MNSNPSAHAPYSSQNNSYPQAPHAGQYPQGHTPHPLKPVITVIGVGGAGSNAVDNMIISNLQGVDFIVANTDAQALEKSLAERKIQLGPNVTKGLGAGAAPEVGNKAAEESREEIKRMLSGSHMLFITAGMGGGTGTGAAPVIAAIAKEMDILTIGVVTKPFAFEGAYRMRLAENGLNEMQKHVDTLIIIPNQNLFRIANEKTTFAEAFKMADEVLHAGVRGVTDLIIMPGLINLDFADIKTVMSQKGEAMMGTGEALVITEEEEEKDVALQAAEAAISNPLLDHCSIEGAKAVLINITGGRKMTLTQVDRIANRIREEVGSSDANIIFGSTFDNNFEGIRVSVIATGIDRTSKTGGGHENYKHQHASNKVEVAAVRSNIAYSSADTYNIEKFDKYNLPAANPNTPTHLSESSQIMLKMGGTPVDNKLPANKLQNNSKPANESLDTENKHEIPAYLRRKK